MIRIRDFDGSILGGLGRATRDVKTVRKQGTIRDVTETSGSSVAGFPRSVTNGAVRERVN